MLSLHARVNISEFLQNILYILDKVHMKEEDTESRPIRYPKENVLKSKGIYRSNVLSFSELIDFN